MSPTDPFQALTRQRERVHARLSHLVMIRFHRVAGWIHDNWVFNFFPWPAVATGGAITLLVLMGAGGWGWLQGHTVADLFLPSTLLNPTHPLVLAGWAINSLVAYLILR